jgi:hypothetical protein
VYDQIRAAGTVSIDAMDGRLKAYDLYGNPYPIAGGRYRLPFSMASVYLEAPGVPTEIVAQIIAEGRVDRVPPVEFLVDDFIEPIDRAKSVDFEVHNVLSRRINGTVTVEPPSAFKLQESKVSVALNAGASQRVRLPIRWAKPHPANAYPFTFSFDGAVGNAEWMETLHVNTIAYGRPTIDGSLWEWKDAIPVYLHGPGVEFDLAGVAWRPWETHRDIERGLAEVRLLWDDRHLYVGVRDRNVAWRPKPRLSTRRDESYFGTGGLAHTYVKDIWDAAPYAGHCLQIGLRFAPLRIKVPPYGAVPARMLAEDDTDTEYAVWAAPGGEAEIWRSNAPRLGLFNFLPRCMPHGYQGVPKAARAVVKRYGTDTIYELAIPFADMPGLEPTPGSSVRIALAIPGSGIELGARRSRTRSNGLTLKPTWLAHPSNEIRWGFLKKK